MPDILADIGTAVGTQIKSLSDRVATLEGAEVPVTPPSAFTINPVQWTNLTEINLSGEKAQNISFDPPPLGLGVEVEVLASWINGGKTAQVGEIYTIDLVQATGGMRLTGNGQSLFASANQLATQVKALNTSEGQVVETITEFTSDLVGREVRAVQDQPLREMVQGEIYTLTNFVSTSHMTHSGGANIIIGQQTSNWELLSETIRKPYLWTVANGTLDQEKLAQGIIKGFDASAGVQQMFTTPLTIGTKIVVKVERSDTNSGSVAFKHVKLDGNTRGGDVHIPRDDGFVEYTVTDADMHGIRFATMFGSREIASVSVFQGEVSGGSVQANGNGGLEKIAGASAFNAGASSTNFIEGNSNGYVQFQWGAEFKSQRIGLTYQDVDFENINPFQMTINGNGHVFTNGSTIFSGGNGWATQGDYFRIRHYASDNTVRFQRRQEIFNEQNESLGEDYVTFHTHSDLTNGNNLYVDTSLFHIGSLLNDVLLAT